ncbi:hypothetical protein DRE_03877 [Drechslerella stenobrocha 248]|uniref:DUF6699 domain-containing protein n=1 Tax=Drechslerella stenobrocha 248 TaxID=1043628 RepID=W7ICL4_9PEZI|nr:hypothetical protein DRE_03877 [Drechslerella stenobrocha 248]
MATSPVETRGHRRASSSASGVLGATDLTEDHVLNLPKEAAKIGWKINTASSTLQEPDLLKKHLTTPPMKKIDLQLPTGLTITARNLKGVTFKDALDAIHKQYKKRADDELPEPYLAGFWHDEEDKGKAILRVALGANGPPTSSKKKGKGADKE